MSILPACLCTKCMWCLWRPHEGFAFPGVSALNHWAISSACQLVLCTLVL